MMPAILLENSSTVRKQPRVVWQNVCFANTSAGADPEVEEGGGRDTDIEWGWCGRAARAARRNFFANV